MKKTHSILLLLLGISSTAWLTGCNPTPPTVEISKQVMLDSVNEDDLFNNQFVLPEEIEASKNEHLAFEIRAFRHKFNDDTTKFKPTWVMGYVTAGSSPATWSLPGPTIEVKYGNPLHVQWINRLEESILNNKLYPTFSDRGNTGNWYPIVYDVNDKQHIPALRDMLYPNMINSSIPICGKDNNLNANLKGNLTFESTPYFSTSVHLHGSNVSWYNDGYPSSCYVLKDKNGSYSYKDITYGVFGVKNAKNNDRVSFTYPNTFPEANVNSLGNIDTTSGNHGAILWYHDHAMMRTSVNVYAGLAGAYLIEGKGEDRMYSKTKKPIPDIPLLITDKSFTQDGYLYYHNTKHDTTGSGGQPEFYGNTIAVNGKLWPKMPVNKGVYRFRVFNTSSSRFYRLGLLKKVDENKKSLVDNLTYLGKGIDASIFKQIGTEGGLMKNTVQIVTNNANSTSQNLRLLTLAPGERADVIIDFSADSIKNGQSIYLVNLAPSIPYQQDTAVSISSLGKIRNDKGKLDYTNFVMMFKIDTASKYENLEKYQTKKKKYDDKIQSREFIKDYEDFRKTTDFKKMLSVSTLSNSVMMLKTSKTPSDSIFNLRLREAATYAELPDFFKKKISKVDSANLYFPLVFMNEEEWNSEVSQKAIKYVTDGSKEVWAIKNETADTHPIHIHLNRFKVLYRKDTLTGQIIPPDLNENQDSWKDVVRAKPGMITYLEVIYVLNDEDRNNNREGQFVYHCHILEHEDASMMRRFVVTPNNINKSVFVRKFPKDKKLK